jgi:eukaryotic-like serine/threonine-protein kinase
VAFSADGTKLLATNDAGGVLACNLRDGTVRTVKTANRSVHEKFSLLAPDGSSLVVRERIEPLAPGTKPDDVRYKAVVYDLSRRRGPMTLPPVVTDWWAWQWSPDGGRLALVHGTGDLTLWDAFTGRLIGRAVAGFGNGSSRPAFLPAGDVVIAVCGDVFTSRPFNMVVWKPATSQLDRQTIPNQGTRPSGKIVVAPYGRNLAYTAGDRAGLWDLSTLLRRFLLVGHNGKVTDLAFAPDGRTLATTSVDRTVQLWSVASGQELLVLDGHTGPVRAVAFTQDGRMLASCGDSPDGGIEVIAWFAEGSARASPPPMRFPFSNGQ